MYHGNKIGVFVSHIFGDYQRRVCQGVIDRAAEFGASVELYASLLDGEDLGTYAAGEFGVLSIPNFESLDGIIMLTGTYLSDKLKESILSLLKKHPAFPVVEVTNDAGVFPTIRFDNNSMTGTLTDHLIDEHEAKRLCFLGCAAERQFSDIREQAFRDSVTSHDLTLTENDIYRSTYDPAEIRKALKQFTLTDKPDAVVCYNDRMAYLFIDAAMEAGLSVPDDLAVTGCDNLYESAMVSPALTTVTFPVENLGSAAVETLQKLIHGQRAENVTVYAEPVYRCSCGCSDYVTPPSSMIARDLNARINSVEKSIVRAMNLSVSLQEIGEIDDALDIIEDYVIQKEDCSECYLCLYSDWDSVSSHILALTDSDEEARDTDQVLMKLGIKNGKRLPECEFLKNTLLPPQLASDPGKAYLFAPLYFNEKSFGYLALAYDDNRISYHFQSVQFMMNVNRLLQSVRDKKSTGLMIKRLETIYLRDGLTGLLNKHGFEQAEEALLLSAKELNVPLCCFFLDLDGLKTINDTFGHGEGNFALQVIGQAIKSWQKPEDLAARFSGDEFYILGLDYSEQDAVDFLKDVQRYLANYNKLSDKPYRVSLSGGYSIFSAEEITDSKTIYDHFSIADTRMYEEKRSKVKDILK